MYVITGAGGRLGRCVIDALLTGVSPSRIVAAVRTPAAVSDFARKGVRVREADYDRPETLAAAFAGAERILLISSNQSNGRLRQHNAVIDAAGTAGVELIAYTSMLHADTAPADIAIDHRSTEQAIIASGLPAAVLRNGPYTENKLHPLSSALKHGVLFGAAGGGRISTASREDFAAATAAVLTTDGHVGRVYELAGDEAFTMPEFAAEVSRQAGMPIAYIECSETDYRGLLTGMGVPESTAATIAGIDAAAAADTWFYDGRDLSELIGRPTTSFAKTVAASIEAQRAALKLASDKADERYPERWYGQQWLF